MSLKNINLPDSHNYIACFLTLDCNLKCPYCINSFNGAKQDKSNIIPGEDWVRGLNRLLCRSDVPITLQGGEPSLHPDFIWIIKNIRKNLNIDILTNLTFDIDEFIKEIEPGRLSRGAVYPNIRASYHPGHADPQFFLNNALKMQKAGFSIGVYGIIHPDFESELRQMQNQCQDLGIDFRTKEFLGEYGDRLHGTYLYPEAIGNKIRKKCLCRTTEFIIGPDTDVFRCHHDLYKAFSAIGNILDDNFVIEDHFRKCDEFGDCNPCDIKVKTNRFQIFGHTSVEIKEIKEFC